MGAVKVVFGAVLDKIYTTFPSSSELSALICSVPGLLANLIIAY